MATGLPDQVTTKQARGNVSYYILKQTHEPILRRDDGQNYTSRILSGWSRSVDYTRYTLCPDTSLRFSSNIPFSIEVFRRHLDVITKQFDPIFSLKQEDKCFIIKFEKTRKSYADFLTLYENAPTQKESDKVESGLGPFFVKTISAEKIALSRKKPLRNAYNEIVLYEYHGTSDPNLANRNIKDFNLIPDFDVPKWVPLEYVGFRNVELKSVALIINHPDPDIRKTIYNCADVQTLRKAYFPQKSGYYNIQNILPIGIAEAKAGLPAQTCQKRSTPPSVKTPIVLANWMHGNSEGLNKFTRQFNLKTNLRLKVVDFSPHELVKVFNKKPRPYNLLVLVFDAVRADPNAFFDSFAKSDGFHDFEIPVIKKLYTELNREDNDGKRKVIAARIANEILDQSLALPLYQSLRTLYYPKEIKNLTVGTGFLEYPEVGDLKW